MIPKGLTAIVRRINRITRQDNLGDHKYCRDGVWELRIDSGPGYRVHYGQDDGEMVLLLCGGDKKTQRKDIDNAVNYWVDHLERRSFALNISIMSWRTVIGKKFC